MKKPKHFDKRFLPMLWIGLVLWLGSMAVTYIMEMTGNAPTGQTTLISMGKTIFQQAPIFILLLLCVVQPVFEEFAFRLWTVGKKWTTIVCLVLMAFFVLSEMKVWGLLFIVAFIVVWLCVKERYMQLWLNAFVTSLAFSLSHISGFGEFGWGLVFGLTDIFGMALVLCWLAININFWLAPLLHVLNNSLAIILPLVLLPDPVTSEVKSTVGDEVTKGFKTIIEPVHALRNNGPLIEGSAMLTGLPDSATDFYMVGEPAQIAMHLAIKADSIGAYYYDWVSRNESLEERVIYRVSDCVGPGFDYAQLRNCYLTDIALYLDDTIVADTVEVMFKEVWLVYDDGREEQLTDMTDDFEDIFDDIILQGVNIITEAKMVDDTTVSRVYYTDERPWAENEISLRDFRNKAKPHNYKYDYRDSHKVKYVVFKLKSEN